MILFLLHLFMLIQIIIHNVNINLNHIVLKFKNQE